MNRRQFLASLFGTSLSLTLMGCGEDLVVQDPCHHPPSADQDWTPIQCPQGLEAVFDGRRLWVGDPATTTPLNTVIRFGFATDLHFAERSSLRRHFSLGTEKLRRAVDRWNHARVDFAVMGGDYTDSDLTSSRHEAIADLKTIESVFDKLDAPRYYALGNHDLDRLSKDDILAHSAQTDLYHAFGYEGFRFIFLDPNYYAFDDDAHYRSGNFSYLHTWVNPQQLEWLRFQLRSYRRPTLIFCHQRLSRQGGHFINNAPDIRRLIADHPHVIAVFTGHSHINENERINGVHHFCMNDMVSHDEHGAHAVVHLFDGPYILVQGFDGQKTYLRQLPGQLALPNSQASINTLSRR